MRFVLRTQNREDRRKQQGLTAAPEEKEKGGAKAEEASAKPAKPEITYDDFAKLQFQIGEVVACEEVKKSRKLLCSKVKIGDEVRQIVSGIVIPQI